MEKFAKVWVPLPKRNGGNLGEMLSDQLKANGVDWPVAADAEVHVQVAADDDAEAEEPVTEAHAEAEADEAHEADGADGADGAAADVAEPQPLRQQLAADESEAADAEDHGQVAADDDAEAYEPVAGADAYAEADATDVADGADGAAGAAAHVAEPQQLLTAAALEASLRQRKQLAARESLAAIPKEKRNQLQLSYSLALWAKPVGSPTGTPPVALLDDEACLLS